MMRYILCEALHEKWLRWIGPSNAIETWLHTFQQASGKLLPGSVSYITAGRNYINVPQIQQHQVLASATALPYRFSKYSVNLSGIPYFLDWNCFLFSHKFHVNEGWAQKGRWVWLPGVQPSSPMLQSLQEEEKRDIQNHEPLRHGYLLNHNSFPTSARLR